MKKHLRQLAVCRALNLLCMLSSATIWWLFSVYLTAAIALSLAVWTFIDLTRVYPTKTEPLTGRRHYESYFAIWFFFGTIVWQGLTTSGWIPLTVVFLLFNLTCSSFFLSMLEEAISEGRLE
jgi:hypothetical protein